MADTVRFVSAFMGYSGAEPTTSASRVTLTTPEGDVEGVGAACRYIATHGSKAVLGAQSPEGEAQVDEWLTWVSTELSPLVDAQLFKLNDHLATRTFLVGSSLSLADIVVAGTVQPAVVAFPAAQTLHFCNLLRWFDLIQALAGPAASVFHKQLALAKPKFLPPAPLPPPAPKAADAKGAPVAGGDKKGSAAAPAAAGGEKKGAPAAAPAAGAPAAAAAAAAAAAGGDKKGAAGGENKSAAAAPAAAAAADGAAAAPKGDKGKKAESKEGKKEGGGGGKKAADVEEEHIGRLDIRVGTIVKCGPHPNADSLYLEEIDLGEEKPRQVISGLVKFVPQEKMEGRRVLVVCNLKPAKMREIMSYGMVLCASNNTHDLVDPVLIPEGVPNGEAVTFEGFPGPPEEQVNPKKKLLEKLFPDMVTDAAGVPNFKGAVFMTSKGPITSTIPNAHVA
ncbi:hypothetical protein FOA52_007929 [Chlamydomonas sp. UWO 241]|nr:hypothetical protein FOA52_007929 [Chlamydomonas sp. UWO 241]